MLGPMNPALRPVVSRLWVPVLATSVESLMDTPLPRGIQPSFPPSSKSADSDPVSADLALSTVGPCERSGPAVHPSAATAIESRHPWNVFLILIRVSPLMFQVSGARSADRRLDSRATLRNAKVGESSRE